MNQLIHMACAAAMLFAACGAQAAATVTFVDIGKMSDVPRDYHDRENMQYLLREHIVQLAEQLPA
ncbi:MAG: DUF3016 domain-containing protein, partial [Achromobacter pestifer]